MKKCLPLELTKKISNSFPEVWGLINQLKLGNHNSDLHWPDWCYLPIGGYLAVIECLNTDMDRYTSLLKELPAIAPWRTSKQIYEFDPDLERLLYLQANDIDLPKDILFFLPYPSIYVKIHHLFLGDRKLDGFYVFLEFDVKTQIPELRFLYITVDGFSIPSFLHLKYDNLKDAFDDAILLIENNIQAVAAERNSPELKKDRLLQDIKNQSRELFVPLNAKALQLVLYILADNSEIVENPRQKTIRKPRAQSTDIKDRYAEIRKWDVGIRIGKTIRKAKLRAEEAASDHESDSESLNENNHTVKSVRKRPHIRKGHWHHFWTGKRNDKNSRKLIVRFIPPVFVGLHSEELPITVHKVIE